MKRLLAFSTSAVVALALCAAPAMAEPPYEPNDSLLTAAGPLAVNTTYTAGIETSNDKDYYYFYVTGPSTSQVSITITFLGPKGASYDGVGLDLNNTSGTITSTNAEGQEGATGTVTQTLNPGKYFVLVTGSKAGLSYKFTTTGTTGAFGAYATIQAQCQAALGPVNQYQAQVASAEANLKKAEVNVKKYGESKVKKVRLKVRHRYAHVKEVVKLEKESLKGAEAAEFPWCSIPQ